MDDSYNSNPAGLRSALKSLVDIPSKRKVAVVGDMLELGEKEIEYHIQAGKEVVEFNWNILITAGHLSCHISKGALLSGMNRNHIYSFLDSKKTSENIQPLLKEGDLVLVKGSRRMKMEKIVNKLKQEN